jgi:hypothetical protein
MAGLSATAGLCNRPYIIVCHSLALAAMKVSARAHDWREDRAVDCVRTARIWRGAADVVTEAAQGIVVQNREETSCEADLVQPCCGRIQSLDKLLSDSTS